MTLSERLVIYREKKGYSIEDVSKKTGLEISQIEDYEKSVLEPDTDTLIMFANLYGTKVEMLRYGEDVSMTARTMFPNDAKPAFSLLAEWKVLVGALMMFAGIGGILLLVMRAIGEGYDTLSLAWAYGNISFVVLGGIFIAGLIMCVISIIISVNKKGKK